VRCPGRDCARPKVRSERLRSRAQASSLRCTPPIISQIANSSKSVNSRAGLCRPERLFAPARISRRWSVLMTAAHSTVTASTFDVGRARTRRFDDGRHVCAEGPQRRDGCGSICAIAGFLARCAARKSNSSPSADTRLGQNRIEFCANRRDRSLWCVTGGRLNPSTRWPQVRMSGSRHCNAPARVRVRGAGTRGTRPVFNP
jgi:hypothetical protein